MRTSTRTSTAARPATARAKTPPADTGHAYFEEPAKADGFSWRPADDFERRLVEEAIVPTFRHYAAEVAGHASPYTRREVIYATAAGLRWGLLEGLYHSRLISRYMVAAAWWRLGAEERAALARYVRTGVVEERRESGGLWEVEVKEEREYAAI